MRMQLFKCTFKSSNKNYIDALVRIYPDIVMDECYVNGVKVKIGQKSFKELNEVIDRLKLDDDEIELTIIASNEAFTTAVEKVFPTFKPQAEYANPSVKDCKRLEQTIDSVNTFLSAESGYYKNCKELELGGVDCFSKDDAWKVLHALHAQQKIFTAIDMPSTLCIFFLTAQGAFTLDYSRELSYNEIKRVIPSGFDIDEGFIGVVNGSTFITREMHKAFNEWKKNGFKGDLFPNLNNVTDVVSERPSLGMRR